MQRDVDHDESHPSSDAEVHADVGSDPAATASAEEPQRCDVACNDAEREKPSDAPRKSAAIATAQDLHASNEKREEADFRNDEINVSSRSKARVTPVIN